MLLCHKYSFFYVRRKIMLMSQIFVLHNQCLKYMNIFQDLPIFFRGLGVIYLPVRIFGRNKTKPRAFKVRLLQSW